MKSIVSIFLLFSFLFGNCPLFCDDEACVPEDAEVFYTDIDDDLFNRGKFVGNESDEYLRARRRARNQNWAVAIGSTTIGIAALVLVGQNHQK